MQLIELQRGMHAAQGGAPNALVTGTPRRIWQCRVYRLLISRSLDIGPTWYRSPTVWLHQTFSLKWGQKVGNLFASSSREIV